MNDQEYLVSYGTAGDFSRFRTVAATAYQRGDRVVVRSPQGIELGVVLCPATEGHGRFLSRTALGELLRLATPEDEATAANIRARSQSLFDDAQRLVAELNLPLEIIDVEILLDGRQANVQHLRRQDCDYRPLVSALSRKHDLLILMHNLALPAEVSDHALGCGKPDCGQVGGGGCSSCGSGGGCSAGGCGQTARKEDVTAYLAGLRRQMESRPARTSLL
jgi:hypothetical protein